jgi:hypothetical protein
MGPMAHISLNRGRSAADNPCMRLLQLSLEPGERAPLDLHPALSVVQGLDGRARDRLVRTVEALASGEAPPCPGLAEAHGVMLPLDEPNVDLLELRTDADPVVRRADLPGAVADPSAGAPVSGTGPDRDPVDELLRDTADGVHTELDAARRHHRDTREALEVLRDAADATARELADASERRRALTDAISGAAVESTSAVVGDSVEALERDLRALDAGIAELAALDIEPVRVLVEAIEEPGPVAEVPSPEAQALADEFVRLHHEVAALEERMEAEGRGPGSALRRLDAARLEARVAEEAMTRQPVSSEDEAALREAHEAVLDAERKASGIRSRSGQRKLAQALARQQEILDRVGFPTWSAYVMGASLMGVDQEAKDRLAAAERELAGAEEAWARISAELEADPDHHALLDQLEEVEVRAVGLLLRHGAPVPDERDDLERCLRDLRQPVDADADGELVATLVHQLRGLGLQVDPDDPARALAAAHLLLEECAGVPERLEELANERRRLEARLVEARNRAEARAWEVLEAAVEQPADERLAEMEESLSTAREAEQALVEALEARQALVEAAAVAERAAARRARAVARTILEADQPGGSTPSGADGLWHEIDPEAIELYLLARLAALRQVSYAGSVPLVLVEPFRGLDEATVRRALDALSRMSESVQIVVASDDPVVGAWAADQGADRAAILTVAPAFA